MSLELDTLLAESEKRNSCLAATSESLRRALTRRVKAGYLVSPAPRLFARTAYWEDLTITARSLHILRGTHTLYPNLVFCHVSAAVAWGLSVPYRVQGRVQAATSQHSRLRSTPSIERHNATTQAFEIVDGLPVTLLEQTTFDCLRTLGIQDAVAIGDSALRISGLKREQLCEHVESLRSGFPGAARARLAASLTDPRSANGGESIARVAMYQLGFAAPELQVRFSDPLEPDKSYFADYVWGCIRGTSAQRHRSKPRWNMPDNDLPSSLTHIQRSSDDLIIGELDGVEKIIDPELNGGNGPVDALIRERKRESRLSITRAAIVRFSFDDVLDPAQFNYILETFGVPRDHEPLVRIPPLLIPPAATQVPFGELTPPEAYGL